MDSENGVRWSREAEQSVLGAMILDAATCRRALDLLEPEDFHREAHATLFRAAGRLSGRGVEVDAVTLSEELRSTGELEAVGGMKALGKLVDAVPNSEALDGAARTLREHRTLRAISDLGEKMIDGAARAGPGRASELVSAVTDRLRAVSDRDPSGESERMWDMADVLADPESLKLPKPLIPGIAYPEHLTLYCGEPKVGGKTSFLTYGAAAVACRDPFLGQAVRPGKVLWIMGEGSKTHIGRYLAQVGASPPKGSFVAIRSGADPVGEIERYVKRFEPDLVVVDSLGTWIAPLEADLNKEEVVPPLRRLERLARSGPAIVVIHHGRKEDGDPAGSHKIKAIPDLIRMVEGGEHDQERVIRGTGRWHVPTLRYRMEVLGDHPDVSDLQLVRFRRVDPNRETEEQILDYLELHPDASKRAIRAGVDGSHAAIDDALQELVRNGLVDRDTSGRAHTHRIRQNP